MKKKAKKMARPTVAPETAENVPTGREFVMTESYQRLEADVARRKALGLFGPREPTQFNREPREIGKDVIEKLRVIRERHGITEEGLEQAQRALETQEQAERVKLLETQKEGRWKSLCPPLFREPFDRGKVPKDSFEMKAGERVPVPGVKPESIDDVLGWEFQPKGLFIIGDSGRSKTRAMFTMLRREVIDKNRSAIVLDGIGFANQCSVAFGDSSTTERWLRTMLKPDIVVIDDLAKRFTPATQQGFFAVLDRRTAHMKPVIITTNCSGEMLDAMINDPQLSRPMRRRMRQYCQVVVF